MKIHSFGKKKFTCERAGFYLSVDKTIGIYHVMRGTSAEAWEAYLDSNGSDDPMNEGTLLASALSLNGIIVQLLDAQIL